MDPVIQSEVFFRGNPIGEVADLHLRPGSAVLVEVSIERSFHPSKNDTFALVHSVLSYHIEFIPGKRTEDRYKERDTISGVVVNKIPLKGVVRQFDSIFKKRLWDSLIAPSIEK